jgi:hypothetical protein
VAPSEQPVANGIRTDHPIPNLPFVDDSHVPIEDPEAIEALGRHPGTTMWGRSDVNQQTGEWSAFTTDPKNHAYSWLVRYHPEHGRSVELYHDRDVAGMQSEWYRDRPLLARLGGYWWDGTNWYRPRRVLSWAAEGYMRRPVRQPTTITAADLLDDSCDPTRGQLRKVTLIEADATVTNQQWRHDLALWARHRQNRPDAQPAERCVVTLNAPELAEGSLLGAEEFAAEAGIAASTLRAYIARDEADIPVPQTSDGGRKRWSRPVVQDWLEQRRRDNPETALASDPDDQFAPGLRELWTRLTKAAMRDLWERPAIRKRWSRVYRNEQAVREMALEVGWSAALHLESVVPFGAVGQALTDAILREMQRWSKDFPDDSIGLSIKTGELLGWFIHHKPSYATSLFGTIVREAGYMDIPAAVTKESLLNALRFDGGFEDREEQLTEFFALAFPPEK